MFAIIAQFLSWLIQRKPGQTLLFGEIVPVNSEMEMIEVSNNPMLESLEALGFEETEVEDGIVVLGLELSSDGHYALITDDDGAMPQNGRAGIIFAYYTPDGSFLWSASFKNFTAFEEIWTGTPATFAKLEAILEYRKANETF